MTYHPVFDGLPVTGNPNAALLRAALMERTALVIESESDIQNMDLSVDEDGSAASVDVRYLIFDRKLYLYDSADTTTAHDGITTLVSADGKRFKSEDIASLSRWTVEDRDRTEPSGGESVGEAYLVPSSPTGAWASNGDDIAVLTARGWMFIAADVGMILYVADEDAIVHYDSGGDWTDGLPANGVGQSNVWPYHLKYPFGVPVEDQTTTSPPGSPTSGVAYIIGSSATGAWSGKDGQIAIYRGSAWDYFAPAEGWIVWDKAPNAFYVYGSSSWAPLPSGAIRYRPATKITTGSKSISATGASGLTTSNTVAEDSGMTITHAAASTANRLVFTYKCNPNVSGVALGLFVDSETNARDETVLHGGGSIVFVTEITPGDTASHTYRIRFGTASASRSVSSRFFWLREEAVI